MREGERERKRYKERERGRDRVTDEVLKSDSKY